MATPPAPTFDGQLQRMRDRNRALEAGEALEEDTAVDRADVDDAPEADEVTVEQLADRVVATLRQRGGAMKPLALWQAVGEVGFDEKKAAIDLLANDGVIAIRQDGIALR